MEFSEEQLIEVIFQILKALEYINRFGLHMKSMLRMQHINFDERVIYEFIH